MKLRINFLHPLPWILIGLLLSTSLAVHVKFSPDSAHYVDIARNLSSGHGFSTYHLNLNSSSVPDRTLLWPPLYPILLAIGMRIGLGTIWAVRMVLILSFLLISVCIYILGRFYSSSHFGTICIIIWLCITPFIINIYTYAWSEPPFIALSLAFIVVFIYAVKKSFSFINLFIAGILAGLATMCRYIGITSIFAGFLSLAFLFFMAKSNRNIIYFLKCILCLFIGFAVISFPWFIHNAFLAGSITGTSRPLSVSGPTVNIIRFIGLLGKDLVLPLGIMATFLILCHLNHRNWSSLLKNIWGSENRAVLVISITWILLYSIFLIVLLSIYQMGEPLNTRYTCPIYSALIPLLVYLGYGIYVAQQDRQIKFPNFALGIVFLLILATSLVNVGIESHLVIEEKSNVAKIESWIKEETPETSLFVGKAIWWIRFETGRAVLESGYPSMPELNPKRVSDFLRRFGKNFNRIYLFFSTATLEDYNQIQEYRKLGYSLNQQVIEGNQTVYEILYNY